MVGMVGPVNSVGMVMPRLSANIGHVVMNDASRRLREAARETRRRRRMYAAKTLKEEVEKTKKEKEALDARREEQKSNLYFRQGPRSRAVNRLKNMLKACYPGEDAEKNGEALKGRRSDKGPTSGNPYIEIHKEFGWDVL